MKAMTYNIAIFITLILSVNSCGKVAMDKKYPLRLINNSSHSIGLYFATGGQFGILYPDTSLPVTNQHVTYELKTGNTYEYNSGISWDEIFKDLPADTLSIYIFHTVIRLPLIIGQLYEANIKY